MAMLLDPIPLSRIRPTPLGQRALQLATRTTIGDEPAVAFPIEAALASRFELICNPILDRADRQRQLAEFDRFVRECGPINDDLLREFGDLVGENGGNELMNAVSFSRERGLAIS